MSDGYFKACIYHLLGDRNKDVVKAQADESIAFLQLFTKADQSVAENQFEVSLLQAIGNPVGKKEEEHISSKLNKVLQIPSLTVEHHLWKSVFEYNFQLESWKLCSKKLFHG